MFGCYPLLISDRITIELGKSSGQPCIRKFRINVRDVLSWIAAGISEQEILDDHPDLERGGFRAVSDFAAHMRGPVACEASI